MPKPFRGVVNVDIRDSVPDWEPFLQPKAPEGAPNVLMIVWDDVGYGAMDVFGGPIETPTMRRIADPGLRYSNFHTTALCSPTRSSLLTGRNATSNNMACITEGSAGFPGFSARIPFENGTIAEVLNEHGWNTYAIGKWHLTPADEVDLSAWRARWPLGRGFERYYGFLGGETNQWYPDLVYDNHTIPPPATPEEGYHLSKDLTDKAIEFVRDSKAVAPEKPWYMYFCPGCAHAPHHVFKDWSDRYAGRFDEGYEAIRATILDNQKRARAAARRHRAVADQPARRARRDRPRRPAVAAARLRAPLGLAVGRGEAAVRAHGRGVRGLRLLHRRPDRATDRLPRRVRTAREHDHHGRLRQRRQRRGRPERLVQREQVLQQRRPTASRPTSSASTSSAARTPTTTTTPAGRGRSTRRSRTGSASPATRAASRTPCSSPGRRASRRAATCATSTSTRSTSSRRSTTCSASSRPRS